MSISENINHTHKQVIALPKGRNLILMKYSCEFICKSRLQIVNYNEANILFKWQFSVGRIIKFVLI